MKAQRVAVTNELELASDNLCAEVGGAFSALPPPEPVSQMPQRNTTQQLPIAHFEAFALHWHDVTKLHAQHWVDPDMVGAYAAVSPRQRATARAAMRDVSKQFPHLASQALHLYLSPALSCNRLHPLIRDFLVTKAANDWEPLIQATGFPLQQFFTWWSSAREFPVDDIARKLTAEDVRDYRDYLDRLVAERRLSLASARGRVFSIKAWLRWATGENLIPGNLAQGVRAFPKPKTHDPLPALGALEALLAVAAATHPSGPAFSMLTLAALTGCRSVELRRLRYHDVDFANGTVVFTGKSGAKRRIPVPSVALLILHEHVMASSGNSNFVFHTGAGHGLTCGSLQKLWSELSQTAAVELPGTRTWHVFRHFLVTTLVRADVPLGMVQFITGHRELASVATYFERNPAASYDHLSQRFPSLREEEEH